MRTLTGNKGQYQMKTQPSLPSLTTTNNKKSPIENNNKK